jgi:hypothetical protein
VREWAIDIDKGGEPSIDAAVCEFGESLAVVVWPHIVHHPGAVEGGRILVDNDQRVAVDLFGDEGNGWCVAQIGRNQHEPHIEHIEKLRSTDGRCHHIKIVIVLGTAVHRFDIFDIRGKVDRVVLGNLFQAKSVGATIGNQRHQHGIIALFRSGNVGAP